MTERIRARRRFFARTFAAAGTLALAGCDALSHTSWFPKLLGSAEQASAAALRLLPRKAMAQEFTEADRAPDFRSNGTADPGTPEYRALAADGFAGWRLEVGGLVATPARYSLADLRALPSRTQITRHDCVEGWSAIAKWKGTPLRVLLEAAGPRPDARYVVFRCADSLGGDDPSEYYESIDLDDAFHPQTILAWEMNDAPLPVKNGAPLRLRVERQLGYKHAKYLMRIELVASFAAINGGNGGYWEDQGYQWFAGI